MSKKNIIILVAILLAVIIVFLNFSKKPEPKYTTSEVERGEVLQTVSATGTAEASKKLNLSFINSGRVSEIDVKVGDHIESGAVLAKLDIDQLESQLDQAKANLSSVGSDLNKLLKGATPEDLRLSETAVENAQIALDNANLNLADTKIGTERDIASAQASLNSAQTTLDN
ncbi:MAG: biotin/lipoyl-binding protein, partial [Minisyncoccia bacterium]